MCRQAQYQPVILNNNQNQQTTIIGCPHESGQSSHLSDMAHDHESPTFSQSMASLESLGGSHIIGRLNMMVSFLCQLNVLLPSNCDAPFFVDCIVQFQMLYCHLTHVIFWVVL